MPSVLSCRLFRCSSPSLALQPQYPIPPTSLQPVTRQDARFSSEVAVNLSSAWICTNGILLIKCSVGAQWATKGEIEYGTRNKCKTLSWTGIELPCDHCGNAEYRFRFVQGYVKSEIYTGPEIVVAGFGDTIVAPGNGTN